MSEMPKSMKKPCERKRGVVFQEKNNKEEGRVERRREKRGRDNEGGIEGVERSSGVNLSQSHQCVRGVQSLLTHCTSTLWLQAASTR